MIKQITSFFKNMPMPGIYLVFPSRDKTKNKKKDPASVLPDLKISQYPPLFLDTSAIIDGRIADIVSTGFMSGTLVVPDCVLKELQQVADSKDSIKRNRGRRGLDVLNELKKSKLVKFIVIKTPENLSTETDGILLNLAKQYKGRIITTDYNLNKVGKVTGVPILNVNELANMVKTVLLPGEEIDILAIRSGKEKGQSVGYLPDGTMVVIQDGERLIGKEARVTVDRIYQTEAGRMVFATPNIDSPV